MTTTTPFPNCRAGHRPALLLACAASLLIHGGLLAAAQWAWEGATPVPISPLVAIPVIDAARLKPPSGAPAPAAPSVPVPAKAAATTRTNSPPVPRPESQPKAGGNANRKAEARAEPKTTPPPAARAETTQALARPVWTRNPPLPPRRPVALSGSQPAAPMQNVPPLDPMRDAPALVKTAPVTAPRAGVARLRPASSAKPGIAKAPPAHAAPLPGRARASVAGLGNPPPAYPWISRNRGEQGRVILDVEVTAQGRPRAVRVKRSSGSKRLDQAALTAVRDWRFAPARRGGLPVPGRIDVPITFRLTD